MWCPALAGAYDARVADTQNTDTAVSITRADGPRPWALRLVHSGDQSAGGGTFYLGSRAATLGRDPGDEIGAVTLRDNRMSRRHASVGADALGVTVRDLDSKNGTWANGRRVERARLSSGDVLRLGDSVFVAMVDELGADPGSPVLLGRSPAMSRVRQLIGKVAPSPLSVLVVGPTGTGKELVAQAIHQLSGRPGKLVPINCAALPDTLVENALFGHERGAYTHATDKADGAFVRAHRGTLFLDEVGEMALSAQPKLLRALETGEIQPLGASAPLRVDVRVVAATNRALGGAMSEGTFREDLYARLCGVTVETPPLADRRIDVMELLDRFLPSDHPPITADLAEALVRYDWPHNVRELKQLADRLPVLFGDRDVWDVGVLDSPMRPTIVDVASNTGEAPGREAILEALAACQGNVKEAAEALGRSRRQLYRWMETLGIPRGTGRD